VAATISLALAVFFGGMVVWAVMRTPLSHGRRSYGGLKIRLLGFLTTFPPKEWKSRPHEKLRPFARNSPHYWIIC
jgi:hypothetical protein